MTQTANAPPRPRDRATAWLVATLAILLPAGLFLHRLAHAPATTFDDAYMFSRYAQHILAGHGHAWNAGEPSVHGCTSLLHTGVVTLATALRPADPAAALRIASGLPALLLPIALALVCARWVRPPGPLPPAVACLAVLAPFLWLNRAYTYHALTGMDTQLAALCATLLLGAAGRAAARPTRAHLALLVAAAFLLWQARPDMGLVAALTPALLLLLCGAAPRAERLRACVTFAAGFGLALTLDLAAKHVLLGDALPLAVYAKRHGFYDGYIGAWNPVAHLFEFIGATTPLWLALVFALSRAAAPVLVALLGPLALTAAYHLTVVPIMGFQGRYFFPLLPLLVVAVAAGLHRTWRTAPRPAAVPRVALAALLFGLLPVFAAVLPARAAQWRPPAVAATAVTRYETAAVAPLPRLGWWESIRAVAELARRLPDGAALGLSEYGYVGAVAPRVRLLDPLGLHERTIARGGFDATRYLAARPDVLWFPHTDYTRLHAALLDDPTLPAGYDVYPGAFDYGLAVRRDAPPAVHAAFDAAWAAAYPGRDPADYRGTPRQP